MFNLLVVGLCACSALADTRAAVEDEGSALAWLTAEGQHQKAPPGFLRILGEARFDDGAVRIVPSPDNSLLAVAQVCSSETAWIKVLDPRDGTVRELHSEAVPDNGFSLLDLAWAPDSSRLIAKFGFLETGWGAWFDIPISPDESAQGWWVHDLIRALPRENWPRCLTYFKDDMEPLMPPVWATDGTRYENQRRAAEAGIREFLPTHGSWAGGVSRSTFCPPDGQPVTAICDATERPAPVYLLRDHRLLGVLEVVAPVEYGTYFLSTGDGIVVNRVFNVRTPDARQGGDSGAGWESRIVSVGVALDRVDTLLRLPHEKVVVRDSNDERMRAVLLDLSLLRELAGPEGPTPGPGAQATTGHAPIAFLELPPDKPVLIRKPETEGERTSERPAGGTDAPED